MSLNKSSFKNSGCNTKTTKMHNMNERTYRQNAKDFYSKKENGELCLKLSEEALQADNESLFVMENFLKKEL